MLSPYHINLDTEFETTVGDIDTQYSPNGTAEDFSIVGGGVSGNCGHFYSTGSDGLQPLLGYWYPHWYAIFTIEFYLKMDSATADDYMLFTLAAWNTGLEYNATTDELFIEDEYGTVLWSESRPTSWQEFRFELDKISLGTYSLWVDDVLVIGNQRLYEEYIPYWEDEFWFNVWSYNTNVDFYVDSLTIDDHVTSTGQDYEPFTASFLTTSWYKYYSTSFGTYVTKPELYDNYIHFTEESVLSKTLPINYQQIISFDIRMINSYNRDNTVFEIELEHNSIPSTYYHPLIVAYNHTIDKFYIDYSSTYGTPMYDSNAAYTWDRPQTWQNVSIIVDYENSTLYLYLDYELVKTVSLTWPVVTKEYCLYMNWGGVGYVYPSNQHWYSPQIDLKGIVDANSDEILYSLPYFSKKQVSVGKRDTERTEDGKALVYDETISKITYNYTWSCVTQAVMEYLLSVYLSACNGKTSVIELPSGTTITGYTEGWQCKFLSYSDSGFLYEISFRIVE